MVINVKLFGVVIKFFCLNSNLRYLIKCMNKIFKGKGFYNGIVFKLLSLIFF